jgi:hypothetical protein
LRTPCVKRRNAFGIFVAGTAFQIPAGKEEDSSCSSSWNNEADDDVKDVDEFIEEEEDNHNMESLIAILADAKLQTELEVGQLRTQNTKEREQKKAELREINRLLTHARMIQPISRDHHDFTKEQLDAVTLELTNAEKRVNALYEQLDTRDKNDERDVKISGKLNIKLHPNKIQKGKGKLRTMVLELFNVKQLKCHFPKKSARYIHDNIYTGRTLGCIIYLNHGINLSGIDDDRHLSSLITCSVKVCYDYYKLNN